MSTQNLLDTLENNSSYQYFFTDPFTLKDGSLKSLSTRKDSLFSPRTTSFEEPDFQLETEAFLK